VSTVSCLLPHLASLRVLSVESYDDQTIIDLIPRVRTAACPLCSRRSRHLHSHYCRTVHDLPCGNRLVLLRLHVRRFRCRNRHCSRRVFCERLPTVARVRRRQTIALTDVLTSIGFALGGEAGARLANGLHLPTSPATLLRLVRAHPEAMDGDVRVLGVDDWAKRKGRSYGTILVDLERHCPIELLDDATSAALIAWLEQHPGVEIISRDRGKEYVLGATQGAPDAIQVADRWHLLKNLGDTLEALFTQHQEWLRQAVTPEDSGDHTAEEMSAPTSETTPAERDQAARRAKRLRRYEEVKAWQAGGMSLSEIARTTGLSRGTVVKYARAEHFPERARRRPGPADLAPYDTYLRERWAAGCHNGKRLWDELRAQGYPGSVPTVERYLHDWRSYLATGHQHGSHPLTPRQAAWLCTQFPEELDADDATALQQLRQVEEAVDLVYTLSQEFRRIVREQDPAALDRWLGHAREGGIQHLKGFAEHLGRDQAAVEAALTLPWSQGQTEGQINRLKLLKRQMYGRAKLDLLRQRVLHRVA
jgi:transposase